MELLISAISVAIFMFVVAVIFAVLYATFVAAVCGIVWMFTDETGQGQAVGATVVLFGILFLIAVVT